MGIMSLYFRVGTSKWIGGFPSTNIGWKQTDEDDEVLDFVSWVPAKKVMGGSCEAKGAHSKISRPGFQVHPGFATMDDLSGGLGRRKWDFV